MDYSNEFFYYKNKIYMHKTRVLLSPEYIATHLDNGCRISRHAWFDHGFINNNKSYYVFYLDRRSQTKNFNKYAPFVKIESRDIESAISEIIYPVEKPDNISIRFKGLHEDLTPIRDWEVPELMVAWVIFIAFLMFTLVFKQFYLIWPIAGFVFDKIRRDMLNR